MLITYTSKRNHRPDIDGAEVAPSMVYTNWTGGNGCNPANDAAGNLIVAYNGTGNPYTYIALTVTASALYRVLVSSVADGVAQLPIVQIGTGPGGNQLGEYDFRNTTVTDAGGEVELYIYTPGTTIYLSLYCAIGSAGYALFTGASLQLITTLTHASVEVMHDALAYSSGAYTAINATHGIVNLFGIAYGGDDNAISITNSGAVQGQAARTNAIPTVSGRQYKATCYYVPFNTTSGNILAGTSYGNGQLGSTQIAANAAALVDTSDGVLYEFNNSDDSWTYNNITDVNNGTYLSLTTTSTAGSMDRAGLSLNGALVRHVAVRLKRTSASWANYLRVSYTTAAHGISASYYATTGVATLPQNEYVIVVFDMWQLAQGGTDWQASTITGLRVQATDTNAATYDLDFIAVGNVNPLEVTFTATQATAFITLVNANDTNAIGYYYNLRVTQIDSDYALESAGVAQLAPAPVVIGGKNTSLDGVNEQGYLHRIDETWNIVTDKVEAENYADWWEFLCSVTPSEVFTIDLDGTAAAPVDPRRAVLASMNYKPDRIQNSGKWRFPFSVRLLPR